MNTVKSSQTIGSQSPLVVKQPIAVRKPLLDATLANTLSQQACSRVIEMAWEDRTPFEAIKLNFNLTESQVIKLMRRELKAGSFKAWRARVSGRKTKHAQLRSKDVTRHVCPSQNKPR